MAGNRAIYPKIGKYCASIVLAIIANKVLEPIQPIKNSRNLCCKEYMFNITTEYKSSM